MGTASSSPSTGTRRPPARAPPASFGGGGMHTGTSGTSVIAGKQRVAKSSVPNILAAPATSSVKHAVPSYSNGTHAELLKTATLAVQLLGEEAVETICENFQRLVERRTTDNYRKGKTSMELTATRVSRASTLPSDASPPLPSQRPAGPPVPSLSLNTKQGVESSSSRKPPKFARSFSGMDQAEYDESKAATFAVDIMGTADPSKGLSRLVFLHHVLRPIFPEMPPVLADCLFYCFDVNRSGLIELGDILTVLVVFLAIPASSRSATPKNESAGEAEIDEKPLSAALLELCFNLYDLQGQGRSQQRESSSGSGNDSGSRIGRDTIERFIQVLYGRRKTSAPETEALLDQLFSPAGVQEPGFLSRKEWTYRMSALHQAGVEVNFLTDWVSGLLRRLLRPPPAEIFMLQRRYDRGQIRQALVDGSLFTSPEITTIENAFKAYTSPARRRPGAGGEVTENGSDEGNAAGSVRGRLDEEDLENIFGTYISGSLISRLVKRARLSLHQMRTEIFCFDEDNEYALDTFGDQHGSWKEAQQREKSDGLDIFEFTSILSIMCRGSRQNRQEFFFYLFDEDSDEKLSIGDFYEMIECLCQRDLPAALSKDHFMEEVSKAFNEVYQEAEILNNSLRKSMRSPGSTTSPESPPLSSSAVIELPSATFLSLSLVDTLNRRVKLATGVDVIGILMLGLLSGACIRLGLSPASPAEEVEIIKFAWKRWDCKTHSKSSVSTHDQSAFCGPSPAVLSEDTGGESTFSATWHLISPMWWSTWTAFTGWKIGIGPSGEDKIGTLAKQEEKCCDATSENKEKIGAASSRRPELYVPRILSESERQLRLRRKRPRQETQNLAPRSSLSDANPQENMLDSASNGLSSSDRQTSNSSPLGSHGGKGREPVEEKEMLNESERENGVPTSDGSEDDSEDESDDDSDDDDDLSVSISRAQSVASGDRNKLNLLPVDRPTSHSIPIVRAGPIGGPGSVPMKPGPISNWSLLRRRGSKQLMDGLEFGTDFYLLPDPVWSALVAWYGGGPDLPRQMPLSAPEQAEKQEEEEKQIHSGALDLYPLCFRISTVGFPRLASDISRGLRTSNFSANSSLAGSSAAIEDNIRPTPHEVFALPLSSILNLKTAILAILSQSEVSQVSSSAGSYSSSTASSPSFALSRARLWKHRPRPNNVVEYKLISYTSGETPLRRVGLVRRDQLLLIELQQEDGSWPMNKIWKQLCRMPSKSVRFLITGLNEDEADSEEEEGDDEEEEKGEAPRQRLPSPKAAPAAAPRPSAVPKAASKPIIRRNATEVPHIGLINTGNTCYLNSALQCLLHTRLLTRYFISGAYRLDLNTKSVLGLQGRLALEYGELISEVMNTKKKAVAPRKFKSAVSKFSSQFSGNEQHDAQELIAFMLDGLSEDLNRIAQKQYVENPDSDGRPDSELADEWWRNHLRREMSIIVVLFTGQYKSVLTCHQCNYESARFEPFSYLQLPLPEAQYRPLAVVFMPKSGEIPVKFLIECKYSDDVAALKKKSFQLLFEEEKKGAMTSVDNWVLLVVPAASNAAQSPLSTIVADSVPIRSIRDGDHLLLIEAEAESELKLTHSSENSSADHAETTLEQETTVTSATSEAHEKNLAPPKINSGAVVCVQWPGSDTLMSGRIDSVNSDGSVNLVYANHKYSYSVPRDQLRPAFSQRAVLHLLHRRAEKVFLENRAGGGRGEGEQREPASSLYFSDPYFVTPFGIPSVLSVIPHVTTGRDLYKMIWKRHRRSLGEDLSQSPTPSPLFFSLGEAEGESEEEARVRWRNASTPSHLAIGSSKRGVGAFFTLRRVKRGGKSCSHCPWIAGCVGCVVLPDDMPVDCLEGDTIAIDWSLRALKERYNDVESKRVQQHSTLLQWKSGRGRAISIYECLKEFTSSESIPEAFCGRCKTLRESSKKMDLWRFPPILIIHLKRFQYAVRSRKLNAFVDFPLKGLDLSEFVGRPSVSASSASTSEVEEGEEEEQGEREDSKTSTSALPSPTEKLVSPVYDLYAVINHLGASGGGHYTAAVLCSREGERDRAGSNASRQRDRDKESSSTSSSSSEFQWRYFNDDMVERMAEHQVVTSAAYILFYIRRDMVGVDITDIFPPYIRADHSFRDADLERIVRDRDAGSCVLS